MQAGQRREGRTIYISEIGKSCPTEILEAIVKLNAEGRPIWKSIYMQPMYRANVFVTGIGSGRARSYAYLQETETEDVGTNIFERGLCLPSDSKTMTEQQEVINAVIRICFKRTYNE